VSGPFIVTGVGLVSAAGDTAESVLAAMLLGTPLASAAIDGFDATRYLPRKGVKDLSRLSQLACAAAAANARGLSDVAPEEVGVVFGSAWGSLATVIEFEREAHLQGARFVDPILFTETVSNVPAGQVAIRFGWSAFNATLSSGTASGLASLRQAVSFLAEDRGAVAVAGGGDEINPRLISALRTRGWTGPAAGEGACFLTIEREGHARSRDASALGSITASAERFGDAPAELMRTLVERAGLRAGDIDLVVLSEAGEGAVAEVFGEGPDAPAVVIPKTILGETWGASGSLATALALEIMRTSMVPAVSGPHRRDVANALIVDRADLGQQLGLVLSLA
jgi:3-oxoacyl-[acyl-carrier-protein] synthase II